MIDIKLLRRNIKKVFEELKKRNFQLDIENFCKKEEQRKILQIKMENLQAERNIQSDLIKYKKSHKECIRNSQLKNKKHSYTFNKIKLELNNLKKSIYKDLLSMPNILAEDVPLGNNSKDNLEISTWGIPKVYDFPVKDHIEIGKKLGGINFSESSILSGNKFVVLHGKIAHLHRALIHFMIDLHVEKNGYQEYHLPYIVNSKSLLNSGQLPKFAEDLFYIKKLTENENNSRALIPTGEVPLINLVCGKILLEEKLPIKMVAHTPCFRAEAGSYGKNMKGLIRMHQFDKVELVQVVPPNESMFFLEELTNDAEKVLRLLNLPYRKVLLCSGDTGFSSCKTYDLEVWFPSKKSYQEISSCSNTSDFQSRRMKTRYRKKNNKKLEFVHILNGSGLAIDRTLAAILENYQLFNGFVEVPSILQPYMNGLNIIDL